MGSSPLNPSQPFSAPKPRSLPSVTDNVDISQTLATWKKQLDPIVKTVSPQPTPLNFTATNSRGGIALSWSPVGAGDGYEILKSVSGSFSDDLQIIPVKNANQSSFFDGTGGNAQTVSYRIRTTSGTASNPQSQRGPESGVVTHKSIDASDTSTKPTTVFDTYTTDATRALSRKGNYGGIRQNPLGKAGGATVAVGTFNRGSNPAGTPAALSPSTPSVGGNNGTNSPAGGAATGGVPSGLTTSLDLILSGAAAITTDPDSPGVVYANQLWSVTNQTSNYTATNYDDVWCTGTFIVTLPNATQYTRVKVTNRGTGQITVTALGATILGNSSMILGTQYSSVELATDGNGDWTVE